MFAKRLSSISATSWDGVGSSAVYKPSRIARRTDAFRRFLATAQVKLHNAGDAYNNWEDDGLVDVPQRVVAHAVVA